MDYIDYTEKHYGSHVQAVAEIMLQWANDTGQNYRHEFNGTDLLVHPGDTAEGIVADWSRRMEENAEAWRKSPEGIEAARRDALRRENDRIEAERRKRYWAKNPLPDPPFTMNDPAEWTKLVEANGGSEFGNNYGNSATGYMAHWACLMERDIADGKTVAEAAEARQYEADMYGITGFMFGWSVGQLSRLWIHGKELAHWHNAQYIKDPVKLAEADASGGVVNPAILTIG